jgi:hypothetical protein
MLSPLFQFFCCFFVEETARSAVADLRGVCDSPSAFQGRGPWTRYECECKQENSILFVENVR